MKFVRLSHDRVTFDVDHNISTGTLLLLVHFDPHYYYGC